MEVRQGEYPNGLQYIFVRDPNAYSVSASLFVRAGSRYEPGSEYYGAAHFVEHMLFKSTLSKSNEELLKEVYAHGGVVNAETEEDETFYYCKIGPKWLLSVLRVFILMFREPKFDRWEIDTERTVVQNELLRNESEPLKWVVNEWIPYVTFAPDHTLQHSVGGNPKQIGKIDPDALMAFFSKWYTPERMTLSVYGNWEIPERSEEVPEGSEEVSETERKEGSPQMEWLMRHVDETFGKWKGPATSFRPVSKKRYQEHLEAYEAVKEIQVPFHLPVAQKLADGKGSDPKTLKVLQVSGSLGIPESPKKKKEGKERKYSSGTYVTAREDLSETYLSLSWPTYPYSDPHRTALLIFTNYLVGTMVSKLFVELREKRGLVYFVRSEKWYLDEQGRIALLMGVQNKRKHIVKLLTTFKGLAVSIPKEDSKTWEFFRGYTLDSETISQENTLEMCHWYGKRTSKRLPYLEYKEFLRRIETTTADQIREIAVEMMKRLSQGFTFILTSTKLSGKLLGNLKERVTEIPNGKKVVDQTSKI